MKSSQNRVIGRWPAKLERELAELEQFKRDYARLPAGRRLKVIERRERPDFVLTAEDQNDTALYGVELTSVYFSDRTVPDVYMRAVPGTKPPSYTREDEIRYLERVLKTIRQKVESAQNNYGSVDHLILGVFVADPIAHRLRDIDRWKMFFDESEQEALADIHPFTEVVVYNLVNYQAISFTPYSGSGGPNQALPPAC